MLEFSCLLVVFGWDRGAVSTSYCLRVRLEKNPNRQRAKWHQLIVYKDERLPWALGTWRMQESLSKLMETEIFATMVFSSIFSLKEQVNSKWKRASDSTWHGHARAWDDFIEFMSFLLFCLWICSFAKRFSAKQPQSGDPHSVTLNALGLRYGISLSLPLNSLLKPRYSKVINKKQHGVLHVKASKKKTCVTSNKCTFHRRRRNKNLLNIPACRRHGQVIGSATSCLWDPSTNGGGAAMPGSSGRRLGVLLRGESIRLLHSTRWAGAVKREMPRSHKKKWCSPNLLRQAAWQLGDFPETDHL